MNRNSGSVSFDGAEGSGPARIGAGIGSGAVGLGPAGVGAGIDGGADGLGPAVASIEVAVASIDGRLGSDQKRAVDAAFKIKGKSIYLIIYQINSY